MRASRLLQILLILQNRGRMTSAGLARELEVTPRTILRDVDALTEAGLPMVVHAGFRGGIELGFDYRTRLTGLAADEAEALGVLLARPLDDLAPLGLADAAGRARRKLLEALPDAVRARAQEGAERFRFVPANAAAGGDLRLAALAAAVRHRRVVRIQAYQPGERVIHPRALVCEAAGWVVDDALAPQSPVPLHACGDINISAKTFPPAPAAGRS
ncbi:MAG: HTH domain-containing protein [Acidobacteria bacterium]|nr:HTH domain-containing protein [Acidobacteriota bacterium]